MTKSKGPASEKQPGKKPGKGGEPTGAGKITYARIGMNETLYAKLQIEKMNRRRSGKTFTQEELILEFMESGLAHVELPS